MSVHGSGSEAELINSTVSTDDEYAYGVHVDADAEFTGDGLIVETSGNNSDAIGVKNGGTATLTDVNLETQGTGAEGIQAENGASFVGSNVTINTLSDDADASANGILLMSGSSGALENSSISTQGGFSAGVWATQSSSFNGTGITVETFGGTAEGALVNDGSLVTLDDSSLTTNGDDAAGASVYDNSRLEGSDLVITTSGDNAAGIFVSDTGSSVELVGGSITVSGTNADGLVVENGGTATLDSVDTSASGPAGSAILLTNSGTAGTGSVEINGGSLSSVGGALISVESGVGSIMLNGPVDLSAGSVDGRTILADVNNAPESDAASNLELTFDGVPSIIGDIVVSGSNNTVNTEFASSDWTGDLEVAADNAFNLDLTGSEWTGQSLGATSIAVDAASIWNMTASSDSGGVTNAGLISFVPGDAFSRLTANNYIGENGFLGLNTVLGADDSLSDRLVINGGTASGTTGLIIANAGGSGDLTTGDGIRVVEAIEGGTTETDAFYLNSRTAAGAYEYLLFRGGVSGEDDWFLRSHLIDEVPDEEIPLYRPEVPLYAPVPAMARYMGLAFLGTLHERVGEQMNIKPQPDQDEYANGVWARMIGEVGSSNWSGTVDVQARNAELWGIQAGLDIYRAEHSNGHRDHVGIYGGYSNYSARISGFALGADDLQAGKLKLDGPAVGAYWTHYSPSGGYLDGVIQWNWFDVAARSDYGTAMDTRGTGFAASIEAGQPFVISDGWQIEPQAQLIYQTTSIKDSYDFFSALAWGDDDALTGRLGVRMQYTSEDDDKVWQPYVKANLWHGFSGTDRTTFNTTSLETRFGNTSLELGAGITAKLTETVSLYGHVDHRWSVGGDERRSTTGGALGLRVNW